MTKILHLIIAVLLLATSCSDGSSQADALLARADSVMDVRPDSALTLLRSVDESSLSRPQSTLRDLLLAKASVRVSVPLAADSMIPASEYFRFESTLENYLREEIRQSESSRNWLYIFIGHCIIILTVISVIYILLLRNLRQKLKLKSASIQSLAHKIERLDKPRPSSEDFDTIYNFIRKTKELEIFSDNEKQLKNSVSHILDEIQSPEFLKLLKIAVNNNLDNIMNRFENDFPNLSGLQNTLALLTFANLSIEEMVFLTGKSYGTITSYKNKLKNKIAESDSPDKYEYLGFFSSRRKKVANSTENPAETT